MFCPNCGSNPITYHKVEPIDKDLQSTWEISDGIKGRFNVREGCICNSCGANIRAQGLAKAIITSKYGGGARTLVEWVEYANKANLSVCELNSCHELHNTLQNLKNYTFAEYGTESEENIESLTYQDGVFDILVHSETIEHVSDPKRAMEECRRVINDTGIVLFTTPVLWNRKTRRRAEKDSKGKIMKLLPPSYHGLKQDDYLVFFEYGTDIDDYTASGIAYRDWKHQNYVFISNKIGSRIPRAQKLLLRILQKIGEIKE
jgi:SAM-dependent methyltransferase